MRNNLQCDFDKNMKFFIQENAFENARETTAILAWPHCINDVLKCVKVIRSPYSKVVHSTLDFQRDSLISIKNIT